jgi:hypothetical protein
MPKKMTSRSRSGASRGRSAGPESAVPPARAGDPTRAETLSPASDTVAEPLPGIVEVHGKSYRYDAKGSLIPLELVKAEHLLEDGVVRAIFAKAEAMSKALVDFKVNAFAEADAFGEVLFDKYGARSGGAKGNNTLATHDGLMEIQIQVSDQLTFGPELEAAKALVDECLAEWSSDSGAEIRKIVMDAFDVEKKGRFNRSKILGLMRLDIKDPRWLRAMDAIRDSMRPIGSKRYIRFRFRRNHQAAWESLPLDIAVA